METYPDYSVLLNSHILFLLHIAPQRKNALAIVGLKAREGCLSIPGLRGNVARIFQHEVDHLAGILYTDRTGEIWEVEE